MLYSCRAHSSNTTAEDNNAIFKTFYQMFYTPSWQLHIKCTKAILKWSIKMWALTENVPETSICSSPGWMKEDLLKADCNISISLLSVMGARPLLTGFLSKALWYCYNNSWNGITAPRVLEKHKIQRNTSSYQNDPISNVKKHKVRFKMVTIFSPVHLLSFFLICATWVKSVCLL